MSRRLDRERKTICMKNLTSSTSVCRCTAERESRCCWGAARAFFSQERLQCDNFWYLLLSRAFTNSLLLRGRVNMLSSLMILPQCHTIPKVSNDPISNCLSFPQNARAKGGARSRKRRQALERMDRARNVVRESQKTSRGRIEGFVCSWIKGEENQVAIH